VPLVLIVTLNIIGSGAGESRDISSSILNVSAKGWPIIAAMMKPWQKPIALNAVWSAGASGLHQVQERAAG
jgi:hypothetical protein